MPAKRKDLPGTLRRSPGKLRRTYEKTLDSAHEQYDSEERAHRTAWSAVKHVAERTGDHWELKDEPGPSDDQAAQSGAAARDRPVETPVVRARTPQQHAFLRSAVLGLTSDSRV